MPKLKSVHSQEENGTGEPRPLTTLLDLSHPQRLRGHEVGGQGLGDPSWVFCTFGISEHLVSLRWGLEGS